MGFLSPRKAAQHNQDTRCPATLGAMLMSVSSTCPGRYGRRAEACACLLFLALHLGQSKDHMEKELRSQVLLTARKSIVITVSSG